MILILIPNRILIFTNTLPSDTKFGGYLPYNFCYEFHGKILILKKKILKKVCGTKLNFMSIINI